MNYRFIASLAIVYASVFIDAFGVSMIVPILPTLQRHYSMNTMEYSITYAAYCTAQFFSMIIMGKLSDILGRKKLLITSLVGTSLGIFKIILQIYIYRHNITRILLEYLDIYWC